MIFNNQVKKIEKIAKKVESYDSSMSKLTNEELQNKTKEFKERLKTESLDDILPEAFAVCREAGWRILGKKPYFVQVMGGIALHKGNIAQIYTGEGKSVPVDSDIPTPSGWRKAKDLKIGDIVFSKNGQPTTITGVYPQGSINTYEVILSDGRTVKCNNEHLWSIYENNEFKTVNTQYMIDKGTISNEKYTFYLPVCEPVVYSKKELPVEPYIYANILISKNYDNICPDYKTASIKQRKELIRGLINKNGKVDGQNLIINVENNKLKDDILEVIYSLGYICYSESTNIILPLSKEANSDFILNIEKELPHKDNKIAIAAIIDLKINTEQVCFTVDNFEHLFLVGQYVVTHNTLTETLPAYLNALTGKGVHIVTVNDYLAKRDMVEMGKVFRFLGLTVSLIYPQMDPEEKRKAYACDIVYGTNKEFGFDYLRDNMASRLQDTFQKELNYAIIDEVDSILIDEARTPLIISGQGQESTDIYKQADACVRTLKRGEDPKDLTKIESIMENMENRELTPEEIEKKGDYFVKEKEGTVILTDRGISKIEKYFGIENFGSIENTMLSHHINQALKAHNIMHRDKNYIVKDGTVQLVDDFTGRVLDGRRYSDGLHQAIEAKEGVEIQKENNTLATISLQNYFRLYNKISGMTGTAATEKTEFKDIYGLDVVCIPPNKPVIRKDMNDKIYQTEKGKFIAIVEDIKERAKTGQPILIGTPDIEQSEKLSRILKKNGIKHNLLNAKNNEQEAGIVAEAGTFGAITIATNMAGRGTDIMLGGNPEYRAREEMIREGISDENIEIAMNMLPPTTDEEKELKNHYKELLRKNKEICEDEAKKVKSVGGLHVIGTAKHESRRIDNQLRGRSGRQGDPGSSQFFISLEDDIIRMFAGDKIKNMIATLGLPEETAIENKQLTKSVEMAQKRFELKNFEARKSTLEYDDVNNGQRKTIYALRREILEGKDIDDKIKGMIEFAQNNMIEKYIPEKTVTQEQVFELNEALKQFFKTEENILTYTTNKKDIVKKVKSVFDEKYSNKKKELEENGGRLSDLQRFVLLRMIDRQWISYLTALQNLRDSVSLVAYGNEKPVDAYKREAFYMFNDLIDKIKEDTAKAILNVVIKKKQPVKVVLAPIKINLDNPQNEETEKPKLEKAGSGLILKTKDIGKSEINPILKNKV